jgi:hypothetical protein
MFPLPRFFYLRQAETMEAALARTVAALSPGL